MNSKVFSVLQKGLLNSECCPYSKVLGVGKKSIIQLNAMTIPALERSPCIGKLYGNGKGKQGHLATWLQSEGTTITQYHRRLWCHKTQAPHSSIVVFFLY